MLIFESHRLFLHMDPWPQMFAATLSLPRIRPPFSYLLNIASRVVVQRFSHPSTGVFSMIALQPDSGEKPDSGMFLVWWDKIGIDKRRSCGMEPVEFSLTNNRQPQTSQPLTWKTWLAHREIRPSPHQTRLFHYGIQYHNRRYQAGFLWG